jgi:hypothetical protein
MRLQFNREQIKKFADISANLGILFFGLMAAPIINKVDAADRAMVALSGLLSLGLFVESIVILKGLKDGTKL